MDIWIYKTKQYNNFYLSSFLNNNTKEIKHFILHESKNDLSCYFAFLKNEAKGLIGFNNTHNDYPLMHYLINDILINTGINGLFIMLNNKRKELSEYKYKSIYYYKEIIRQLDLAKIWNFNKKKYTSLTDVKIAINYNDITLYNNKNTNSNITKEEIENIILDNENDLLTIKELYKITIGDTNNKLYKDINQIDIRKSFYNELSKNVINFSDVKIGDYLNLTAYLKNTNTDKKSIIKKRILIKPFTYKECSPNYINFITDELKNACNELNVKKINVNNIKREPSYKILFKNNEYRFSKGGLHSKDKPAIITPKDNEILIESDLTSAYPNSIIKRKLYPRHLDKVYLEEYAKNIEKKTYHKKEYLKNNNIVDKKLSEIYKKSLTGGSVGKTKEIYNWQYDPFVFFSCTIGTQFEMLMLIEMLETNNINVISVNTDGVTCLFNKELEELYYNICSKWEKLVNTPDFGKLEHVKYKKIIKKSINDYINIDIEGNIKTTGLFKIEKELHNENSFNIISLALYEYYVNDVPVDETIVNDDNIYNFCKKNVNSTVYPLEKHSLKDNILHIEKLQKYNRYYISNKGYRLYTRKKTKVSYIENGTKVILFNKYFSSNNYDINYSWYVEKANNIILLIKNKQSTLF